MATATYLPPRLIWRFALLALALALWRRIARRLAGARQDLP